jgi:hypothetical protein
VNVGRQTVTILALLRQTPGLTSAGTDLTNRSRQMHPVVTEFTAEHFSIIMVIAVIQPEHRLELLKSKTGASFSNDCHFSSCRILRFELSAISNPLHQLETIYIQPTVVRCSDDL